MRTRLVAILALSILALAACGGSKNVDASSYTCGQFNKSLRTKNDDTAGNYINQLRKQADLGQSDKVERAEITLGILVTCRNKPASTKPAAGAVVIAKKIKAGKFKLPGAKKSTK